MKKLLLLAVCFVLIGCTTYKEAVNIQLKQYGYKSDSTQLVVEKGVPACRLVYEQHNPIFEIYDQVIRYMNYGSTYFWSDYYFKDGKLIKKNIPPILIKSTVGPRCNF